MALINCPECNKQVSDKAVSKWERGLCFPDISVLIPLTEILNISLYDLLTGGEDNEQE